MSFGRSAPGSLGVEEELVLVEAATLGTAPVFSLVVPEPTPRLKPELFACLVETTTPICATADQVLTELQRLRREVAALAEPHGARILAAGTHALARGAGQPIVPEPRYLKMLAEVGDGVYRQLVCGLHVHVGVPSREACLRALEGVVPWLPLLLALSANSPFIEGDDSGVCSARAGRLAELPSGGAPPLLRSWADWEAATAGTDYTRLWWDARPHPRYGTLEVRMADQQTDVRRAAGFAALVQALVLTLLEREPVPYDRGLYARRRVEAARRPPSKADVEALAALTAPAAQELGGRQLVDELLGGKPEAGRQRAVAREKGLAAVVEDVAGRSVAWPQ